MNEPKFRYKLSITKQTSPEEISKVIFKLREQKGREKEVLKVIAESLSFGHDFIVNLFFEEALTYQHLYMNDNGNKKALLDMQKAILKAGFYINKYNITKWQSRYFRFLGRIEDYKKNFKKSVGYYKNAIKYVKYDPDVVNKTLPRSFELEGFLSYATIMLGGINDGFDLSKKVLDKFKNSKEGIELKKKDFTTWVIWCSAVVINTYNALLNKKVSFDIAVAKGWISYIERELNTKEGEYLYRKNELSALKEKLKFN